MDIIEVLEESRPGMIGQVRAAVHKRHLNQRTEQTYLHWISRFVLFHDLKDPDDLGEEEQRLFLSYLKEKIRVSRARLNQATQALNFFYEDVLGKQALAADFAAA
ncbi:site-specific integrase [Marinobacter sp. VGCF2001]|uniref:site-specific integrase n=1 Tax=Marinobacter sp. VGCF2001 TaxID=3417189 RepID=UPI003CED2FFF